MTFTSNDILSLQTSIVLKTSSYHKYCTKMVLHIH